MSIRWALAGAAALLAAGAAFIGTPEARRRPLAPATAADRVRSLAKEVEQEKDHVTAIELATWIRARKPGLRLFDLRSSEEFEEYHLPRAEHTSMEALVSMRFEPTETIVLYSQGGAHAAQGWVFLRALGHPRVNFLSGGLDEWIADVLNPVISEDASAEQAALAEISRYFGGVPRRGDSTSVPTPVKDLRRRGC